MKLWFERWNVNAQHALPCQQIPPAVIAALKRAINALAVNRLRGDSAANNFRLKM
jgi:hypothetical protein